MADTFPYYAGFSFKWAMDRLAQGEIASDAVVLDPWNGSGTTTLAARRNNRRSIGVDMNPVANIVARLRVDAASIFHVSTEPKSSAVCHSSEPLLAWFSPETAARLRDWAAQAISSVAPELCLVTLFRIVRSLTADFQGSNPTWVRRISDDRPAVHLACKELDELVLAEQIRLKHRLAVERVFGTPCIVLTGSSKELPIASGSIDFVLTSPPYLTRIDYAVAYSRELAVLGTDVVADRHLRARLMGTTLIRPEDKRGVESYGPTAQRLIQQISAHSSRASQGYYRKQALQYLNDLIDSISEISRVCKDTAKAVLVVQDSYYKDVPILLANICEEEATLRGWTASGKYPYPVVHTLTTLNRAAKVYAKGPVSETVLELKRT